MTEVSNIVKFEVIVHGEIFNVNSIKEAEDKMKRIEQSDFNPSYIIKKVFSKSGDLLEEIMVGQFVLELQGYKGGISILPLFIDNQHITYFFLYFFNMWKTLCH